MPRKNPLPFLPPEKLQPENWPAAQLGIKVTLPEEDLRNGGAELKFPYDAELVKLVKSVKASWIDTRKSWYVPGGELGLKAGAKLWQLAIERGLATEFGESPVDKRALAEQDCLAEAVRLDMPKAPFVGISLDHKQGEGVPLGQRYRLTLAFKYDEELVAGIKTVPGAKFDAEKRSWSVPLEAHVALREVLAEMGPHLQQREAIDRASKEAVAEAKAKGAKTAPFHPKPEAAGAAVLVEWSADGKPRARVGAVMEHEKRSWVRVLRVSKGVFQEEAGSLGGCDTRPFRHLVAVRSATEQEVAAQKVLAEKQAGLAGASKGASGRGGGLGV